MMPSEYARQIARGGFTLNARGDRAPVEDLGRACHKLRIFVRSDVDGAWNQPFTLGHIQWALAHGMKPHFVIGDLPFGDLPVFQPDAYKAKIAAFLQTVYDLGIRSADFEIGNELNSAPNWLTESCRGDRAFNSYMGLYNVAQQAIVEYTAEHPDANYRVGGPACSTGGTFAFRVLQQCMERGWRMDFVSWHVYGYTMSFEQIAAEVRAIRSLDPEIEILFTEVGYDPFGSNGSANNMSDAAADFIRDLLYNAQAIGVDGLLWLSSYNPDGMGIWLDRDCTQVSRIGEVVLEYAG